MKFGSCLWWHVCFTVSDGSKKKPLFEYDDHYVMLNDYDRNKFYRRALAKVLPGCGKDCSVLDVGAGSGLLSMMAANLGAKHVLAIEANPDLAHLAEQTIAQNQKRNFPTTDIRVLANLSSRVSVEQMPEGRQADVLVTETFGTMLLGEGAINFVPDARDRLLKPNGIVVPSGGCQFVTLVEAPEVFAVSSPPDWDGFNFSMFRSLQDTVYWKATYGSSKTNVRAISDRICALEVDLQRHTRDSVPENRTFRIRAQRDGVVHAALLDWDVWADESRRDNMSNAPNSRNFAGDVAWGWLFQIQEEAGSDWRYGKVRQDLHVKAGEELDVGVQFIARGISAQVRVRRAPADALPDTLPSSLGMSPRMHGVDRGDLVEASEFFLPITGDAERHAFYGNAVERALEQERSHHPTLLDCSADAGVPSLVAARKGFPAVTLTQRKEFAKVLRTVAADNGLEEYLEAYASDPRDFIDSLLPGGKKADIVTLEPPGTPMAGLNPFAILPTIRKKLLKAGGLVIPSRVCFEVGIMESVNFAEMNYVPERRWEEIDLGVWNQEAQRHRLLERLVPHTKWFGPFSTMKRQWLSRPTCIFQIDMNKYGQDAAPPNITLSHDFTIEQDGTAHALVARWAVWALPDEASPRLGAESDYLGRSLTWTHYAQAISLPNDDLGVIQPLQLRRDDIATLRVTVLQGSEKQTGVAGPEFLLRLEGPGVSAPKNSEL